jgi:hypothetical protein
MNEGIPEGEGLYAQIIREQEQHQKRMDEVRARGGYTNSEIAEQWRVVSQAIQQHNANRPRVQISGGQLMSLNDEGFSFFYSMKDCQCLCSSDMYDKIIERAKKLGL